MAFYVYIVLCSDGSFYTGQADNLDARLAAHQDGRFRGYTFTRRPVRLIFHQTFPARAEAKLAEREIKGWSRARKLALADGDWVEVQHLSLRKTPQSRARSGESPAPRSYFENLSTNRTGITARRMFSRSRHPLNHDR